MSNQDEERGTPSRMSRREALKCGAWAGAGVVWTLSGGVPRSVLLGSAEAADLKPSGLHFVQISDTHFGFAKDANPDVNATAAAAIAKINALPVRPGLVLHTGDVTHLSKSDEFERAEQAFAELKTGPVHFTPGEHDVLDEKQGEPFLRYFGKGAEAGGWYSFDQGGVHFIALVNVLDFKAGGMGQLGRDQLDWLKKDLKGRSASTPIVLFAHIPLWTVYGPWGWGTSDAEEAFAQLRRFGSVTVLNGHIHQVIQKVEGNFAFHTAMSTAYPQPEPGTAASPGPLKVPAERLRAVLGVREIDFVPGRAQLALVDKTLAEG